MFIEKVVQLGWFGTSTRCSSSLLIELGIDHIKAHSSSCMNVISKSLCASKIVLVSKLFLWMFCEKILIFLQIILECHLQLSELIVFYCHEVPGIFWSATSYWINASIRSIGSNLLDGHLYNSNIWTYIGKDCPVLFPVLKD